MIYLEIIDLISYGNYITIADAIGMCTLPGMVDCVYPWIDARHRLREYSR